MSLQNKEIRSDPHIHLYLHGLGLYCDKLKDMLPDDNTLREKFEESISTGKRKTHSLINTLSQNPISSLGLNPGIDLLSEEVKKSDSLGAKIATSFLNFGSSILVRDGQPRHTVPVGSIQHLNKCIEKRDGLEHRLVQEVCQGIYSAGVIWRNDHETDLTQMAIEDFMSYNNSLLAIALYRHYDPLNGSDYTVTRSIAVMAEVAKTLGLADKDEWIAACEESIGILDPIKSEFIYNLNPLLPQSKSNQGKVIRR